MKEVSMLDDFLQLQVAADGISATLHLHSMDSSFQCTSKQLMDWLEEHRVIYGIDESLIDEFCSNPASFIDQPFIIAHGDPPVPGKAGMIRYHCQTNITKQLPKVLSDGKVDYKQIRQLNNVRKGQLIAELIPPEAGRDGVNVSGEPIIAPKGEEAKLIPGKHVVLNEEKNKIYAAIDGLVSIVDQECIQVQPVYEIDGDINYEIGNIDFAGTVIVHGNVLSEFEIKASGDIQVFGSVEAAFLNAGGTIFIEHGIVGGKKGKVQASQDINASFIQEGRLEAGENVNVTQFIMHSNVRAGKRICCLGNKGLIVGGEVFAGERIEARIIGNLSATRTVVAVGQDSDIYKRIEQLQHEKKEYERQLHKAEQAAVLFEKRNQEHQSAQNMKLKVTLNITKKQFITQIKQVEEQIQLAVNELEKMNQAAITVKETIYPGTHVRMGRQIRSFKETLNHVVIKYTNGEIRIS